MNLPEYIVALLFFLPAGASNMAPVLANKIPFITRFKTPLDFGHSYRGHRIFGKNKSWRGLFSGIIFGTFVGWLMHMWFFPETALGHYLLVAAAMSAGALIGDAVESFFKRQRGIQSGNAWFPFDQTDYIIGGLLFILPFETLTISLILWIFGIYFGLHLFSSYIGYHLGLKDKPI
jgi:CDP-2,3-bis-(O-geranylgeranyl)-sn-glycerol synthase